MVYASFYLQILLVVNSLLAKYVSNINLRVGLLIAISIFAFLFLFLSIKFQVSKIIFLFGSLIITSALPESKFITLLTFISLYFYLAERLKDAGIEYKKAYLYLAPIIFLGLISYKIPSIIHFDFLKLLNSISSIFSFSGDNYYNPTQTNKNILETLKETFQGNASTSEKAYLFANFFGLVASIFILIALVLFLFFTLKTRQSTKQYYRKKRMQTILLMLFSFIPTIFLVLFSYLTFRFNTSELKTNGFNVLYFLFLLLIYTFVFFVLRFSRRSIQNQSYKEINKKLSLILSLFFVSFLILTFFIIKSAKSTEEINVLILGFLSLSGFSIIAYMLIRLNGEVEVLVPDKIFKEKTDYFNQKYKEFGIDYLNSIEDKKEFVEYLYYLSVLTFLKKGILYEDNLTPKEFLSQVYNYLKSDLFSKLTDAFYIVEYSKDELSYALFTSLKDNSLKLLKELEEVEI